MAGSALRDFWDLAQLASLSYNRVFYRPMGRGNLSGSRMSFEDFGVLGTVQPFEALEIQANG